MINYPYCTRDLREPVESVSTALCLEHLVAVASFYFTPIDYSYALEYNNCYDRINEQNVDCSLELQIIEILYQAH